MVFVVRGAGTSEKMKECHIVRKGDDTRLSIWFERAHVSRGEDVTTHRFVSYDLRTGKELGDVTTLKNAFYNYFVWFGPFGTEVWIYSIDEGLALVDLYEPAFRIQMKAIVKKYPELEDCRLAKIDDEYHLNDETAEIALVSNIGEIVHLSPSLKLRRQRDLTAPPALKHVPNGTGRLLWKWDSAFSNGSRWTALSENATDGRNCEYAYIDSKHRELSRTNVCERFGRQVSPYGAAEVDGEIYLFVTDHSDTLSAAVIDAKSGVFMRAVDYF